MLFPQSAAWYKLTLAQENLLSGFIGTHHLNPVFPFSSILRYTLSLLRNLQWRWNCSAHFNSSSSNKTTVQDTTDTNLNILLPARELERLLQPKTNHFFVEPVSFCVSLNTRIPLLEFLHLMPGLPHVLRALGPANRGQANFGELLQTILGFERRRQEKQTNSLQEGVAPSSNCHQRTKIKRLPNQLDTAEAAHHQLCCQLCIFRDILASREKESSALAADYYRLNNGRRCGASDTNDEWETKRKRATTFLESSLYINVGTIKMRIVFLLNSFVLVAIIHVDIH